MKSYIEVQNVMSQWDSNLQPLGEYKFKPFESFISIICNNMFKVNCCKLNYQVVQTYCKRNWDAIFLIKIAKKMNA